MPPGGAHDGDGVRALGARERRQVGLRAGRVLGAAAAGARGPGRGRRLVR